MIELNHIRNKVRFHFSLRSLIFATANLTWQFFSYLRLQVTARFIINNNYHLSSTISRIGFIEYQSYYRLQRTFRNNVYLPVNPKMPRLHQALRNIETMKKAGKLEFSSLVVTVAVCAVLAGCSSYGPKSMDRDQLDYGDSIGENWKNQMLANIVKLRFVDMPVFVDVGSIVSGYSLETTVNGRLGFNDAFTNGNTQGLGAQGKFTDRPTITYMPKTGDDYLRAILEPVDPKRLLALIQAGYSSELLLSWAVEAINGVHNWSATARSKRSADPEFFEFVSLMQELQHLGAVGFELKSNPDSGQDIIFVLNKEGLAETTLQKSRQAIEIIGLEPGRDRYRVIYAPFKTGPDTLSIQTRSVLQMLAAMAGFIDVPAGIASFAEPGYEVSQASKRPFHVRSDTERPQQSFAQIKYKDYWYWIDNSDMTSKRVFSR